MSENPYETATGTPAEGTAAQFDFNDVQQAISEALARDREAHAAETKAQIDGALAVQKAQHEETLEAMRRQLAGALPLSAVPEHAGGPGLDIRPTWSLAEQEAARRDAWQKDVSAA